MKELTLESLSNRRMSSPMFALLSCLIKSVCHDNDVTFLSILLYFSVCKDTAFQPFIPTIILFLPNQNYISAVQSNIAAKLTLPDMVGSSTFAL
jgi:Mg2+/citrate symporter